SPRLFLALNQISRPSGAQTGAESHPTQFEVRTRRSPPDAGMIVRELSSPPPSQKAISRPSRETRRQQPDTLSTRTLPIGYSSRERPSTERMMARVFPSGPQSAAW